MGPREVKGHAMHIIAQFIQCKLLFAIRCDTMTESCCLFPFSPQLLTPDVVCMFEMYSYESSCARETCREKEPSPYWIRRRPTTIQTHPNSRDGPSVAVVMMESLYGSSPSWASPPPAPSSCAPGRHLHRHIYSPHSTPTYSGRCTWVATPQMMRAVLKDASDHPAWQKTPEKTARKWLAKAHRGYLRDCSTRLQEHPPADATARGGAPRHRPPSRIGHRRRAEDETAGSLTREGGVAEAGAQPQGS